MVAVVVVAAVVAAATVVAVVVVAMVVVVVAVVAVMVVASWWYQQHTSGTRSNGAGSNSSNCSNSGERPERPNSDSAAQHARNSEAVAELLQGSAAEANVCSSANGSSSRCCGGIIRHESRGEDVPARTISYRTGPAPKSHARAHVPSPSA